MAVTTATFCCLNFSSPKFSSPNCPSIPPNISQIEAAAASRQRNGDFWRKQCVVGVTCMIIGVQIASIQENDAIAKDMPSLEVAVESKQNTVPRWSDKRMCPPWRGSSLETIVPENLPRPSARRRYETVRYPEKNSPAVKGNSGIKIRSNSNCFSM